MLLARSCDAWTAFCVGLSFSQENRRGGSAECYRWPIQPSAANIHTGYNRSSYANRKQYAFSGSQYQVHTEKHLVRQTVHVHKLTFTPFLHLIDVTHNHILITSYDDWFHSAKIAKSVTANTQMESQRLARHFTVKKWVSRFSWFNLRSPLFCKSINVLNFSTQLKNLMLHKI